MEINRPEVRAEVEAAFARYMAALVSNDVATLQALFWGSALTIRYGTGEHLHGIDEIGAFRAARSPIGLALRVLRTVITTYGDDQHFSFCLNPVTKGQLPCPGPMTLFTARVEEVW